MSRVLDQVRARLQRLRESDRPVAIAARGDRTLGRMLDYGPSAPRKRWGPFPTTIAALSVVGIVAALPHATIPVVAATNHTQGIASGGLAPPPRSVDADFLLKWALDPNSEVEMPVSVPAVRALTSAVPLRVVIHVPRQESSRDTSAAEVVRDQEGGYHCQITLGGPWSQEHARQLDGTTAGGLVDLHVIAHEFSHCVTAPTIDDVHVDVDKLLATESALPMYRRYLSEAAADRFAFTFTAYWAQASGASEEALATAGDYMVALRHWRNNHDGRYLIGAAADKSAAISVGDLVAQRRALVEAGATQVDLDRYDAGAAQTLLQRAAPEVLRGDLMGEAEWTQAIKDRSLVWPVRLVEYAVRATWQAITGQPSVEPARRALAARLDSAAAAGRTREIAGLIEDERAKAFSEYAQSPAVRGAEAQQALNRQGMDLLGMQ